MNNLSDYDLLLLKRCFTLAENAFNYTLPNPKVGALITNAYGNVIAEAWHQKFGEPHAEVLAITQLPQNFDYHDCTLYVSLEPCCHSHKKTPPCTDLILQKKIPRVVIGTLDPNPHVQGKGIQKLQQAGIKVFLAHQQFEPIQKNINKHFYVNQIHHRPLITLKWAEYQNKIMGDTQHRLFISNPYTQYFTHALRANHQAILVGKNTVLIDKPQLNLRYAIGKNPTIILLDTHAEINPQQYFSNRHGITINKKIQDQKVHWHFLQVHDMHDWKNNLSTIYKQYQIGSILIEGGSTILRSILSTGLWDYAYVIVNPETISTKNPVYAPSINHHASLQVFETIHNHTVFQWKNLSIKSH